MERVLKFDSTNERHADLYRWLYSSFVIAAAAGADQGEKGLVAANTNAAILDKLDAVSSEEVVESSKSWAGLDSEMFGYNARTLNSGISEVVFKPSELSRVEKCVDAAALRFTPLMQRKFFTGSDGLFEFLNAAEKREKPGPIAVPDKD